MSELKPCPFCGTESRFIGTEPDGGIWYISCGGCHANSQPVHGREKAITAWNTRATPSGTVITKSEDTWPADEMWVVIRNNEGLVWSEPFMEKWDARSKGMPELWIGCIWWPADMFEPPRGEL